MKILLTSGASYAPPKGGSTRGNLVWLRALEASGHACRIVSASELPPGCGADRLPHLLEAEIRAFAPDWVLVSSEDVSQRLLRAAERTAFGRLIYLAHTPQFFPFGPESWNPDPEATRIVQRAVGVVAIGKHMSHYLERHAGVVAEVIHPPIYQQQAGLPSPPGGAVLTINPCTVKGIEIFLALAELFPSYPFAGLAGWGTTSEDRAAMRRLPNVRVLESVANIDEVLSQARVLLMPSLWYEGFGLIAMEAMLRGVPVIASNSGGLLEAKEGTGYVIPVNPIERYQPVFDENHMPRPVRKAQDIAPWAQALRTLMTSDAAHAEEAERSRAAARKFVGALRPHSFEEYLASRQPRLSAMQRELLRRRLQTP